MTKRQLPAFLLFVTAWGPAFSATFTVDLSGGGDFATIQPALDAALDGDVITVAPGTYYIDHSLDFNASYPATEPKNLRLLSSHGAAATVITMSDNLAESGRGPVLVFRSGEDGRSVVEGFTLTGGGHAGLVGGGGISAMNGSAPRIYACIITGNRARLGGGIFVRQYSAIEVAHCIVRENLASAGAGIYSDLSPLTISDSLIERNATTGARPANARPTAGLYVAGNESSLLIERSAIRSNAGGGLFVLQSQKVTASRCILSGNDGDGFFVSSTGAPALLLSNCLIDRNNGDGVRISAYLYANSAEIKNCTIAANSRVGVRVDVRGESNPEVINSILWRNGLGSIVAPRPLFPFTSLIPMTYSCVEGPENWPGSGNSNNDPRFVFLEREDFGSYRDIKFRGVLVSLPDYGGDPDYRLQVGSPLVDAGDPQTAAEFDIEGSRRVCGLAVDIGAYENCDVVNQFIRGDCNGNGQVGADIGDVVFLLLFNFAGGRSPPCVAACDADADGTVFGSSGDALYLLSAAFLGGLPPPPPFPSCGEGPFLSDVILGCQQGPEVCP